MLRECFAMVRWDVVGNAPVPGSAPCTPAELVDFLETTAKRLRMGVVTAGWRDRPQPSAANGRSPRAEPREPEPEPEPELEPKPAPRQRQGQQGQKPESELRGGDEGGHRAEGEAAPSGATLPAEARNGGTGDDSAAARGNAAAALQPDEELFYMDEAEAIRQLQREIEEQTERNRLIALGI